MDQLVHSSQLGVFPGNGNHGIINIVALDIGFDLQIHHFPRLVHGIIPIPLSHHRGPFLGGKAAVHAGRHGRRHHGRLNGKSAASAEGIHQNPVPSPGGEHNQRGRQVLRNGSLGRQLPVAPFMQGFPCGIQSHSHLVLHQENADRERRAVLFKPAHMIDALQTLHHGLFHN